MCRSARLFFSTVFLFACFLILTAVAPVYADWEFQESGVDEMLWDICFVDEYHGWAVGDNSTIIATTDGGETWVRQECPVKYDRFREIFFINKDIGYCISNAVTLVSKDGGNKWEILKHGIPVGKRWDISFINENNGWIASGKSIIHTSDAGNTWETQFTSQYEIRAVDFVDENTGWALGSYYFDTLCKTHVFHTTNGGKDWEKICTLLSTRQKLYAISPDELWVGYGGIMVSQDGGNTWSINKYGSPDESPMDFYPFDGFKAYVWFVFDGEKVFRLRYTDDGGESYIDLFKVPFELFKGYSVQAIEGKYVWIAGTNGKLIKYTNDSTSVFKENKSKPQIIKLEQNFPNPFNESTTIRFNLSTPCKVNLIVYDITGELVSILVNSYLPTGKHTTTFDGSDLASGIYFYSFESKGFTKTGKMLLIK